MVNLLSIKSKVDKITVKMYIILILVNLELAVNDLKLPFDPDYNPLYNGDKL